MEKYEQRNRGRKTIITTTLIAKIKDLKENQYPIVKIAQLTNVSRNTVYKVLKNELGYRTTKLIKIEGKNNVE